VIDIQARELTEPDSERILLPTEAHKLPSLYPPYRFRLAPKSFLCPFHATCVRMGCSGKLSSEQIKLKLPVDQAPRRKPFFFRNRL